MAIRPSPSRVLCCCATSRSRPSWREPHPEWNSVCPAAPVVVEVSEAQEAVVAQGVRVVALIVALVVREVLVRVCLSLSL